MKFSGICLLAEDVPALSNFYCQLLQVAGKGDDIHQDILCEGMTLAILKNPDKAAVPSPVVALVFDVENVDQEFQRLIKMDVPVIAPPQDQPWGYRNALFIDPENNQFALRSKI
ncbi:VOC family protein [Enterococcus sp. LJL51]|uniref:VOC family protein n=1 Tax=Enterococcus sp. LJL51 TaxID=3416656 RepID=UPI003CEE386A